VKTLEQVLCDNPPFYPDASTDETKMAFMFLLEDGRLVGNAEGENHSVLLGWTEADGYDLHQLESDWYKRYNALRLCFGSFQVKCDGTRGEFWCLYIEVGDVVPNDAQWATLSKLYLIHGHRNTVVAWDVRLEEDKWSREREGTLADLRRLFE